MPASFWLGNRGGFRGRASRMDFDYEPAERQARNASPLWGPRRRNRWASPSVTKAVDIFWQAVWRSVGAVVAVALSVVGLGAMWLFSAAVSRF